MARDREKLSDRVTQHGYVFSQRANSFADAYPAIASLRVEVEDTDLGEAPRLTVLTEGNFRHVVDCSNPLCGGGVTVGFIVHDLVRERKTDDERTQMCPGYEGSPKGRRVYGKCMRMFRIRTHIVYRPG